jgi:concanavalin A-like lectin/glucanase superfamily protein
MSEYALRFRLLPLAALLCVGSCMSTDGYYRYQDGGPSGAAGDGTPGTAGSGGTTGGGGTTGSAGTGGSVGAAGTTGTAGSLATGRGGTTGAAGATAGRGGTTGSAGRGGTTGTAGVTGTAGAAGVLFSDNFEAGVTRWSFAGVGTSTAATDGSQVLSLSETAGDQYLGSPAIVSGSWTDYSVEARVKVLSFSGTSSSDGVALCARLTTADSFYYFAIQASDGKGKIKVNNGSNSSLSSSLDIGFAMNTWMTLRFDVHGNTLTAYVNGAMKGTYTVTDSGQMLPMGGAGLMIQRANAVVDDFVVRSL